MSQAGTPAFRDGYSRTFGERRAQRGRWIWDETQGRLVDAASYRPPPRAVDAPLITDRAHEGTFFDDGERKVDIGSRRRRREFMRSAGVEDATDCSPSWRAGRRQEEKRRADRAVDSASDEAVRKLYHQRKLRIP